jgi:hypothetical protein
MNDEFHNKKIELIPDGTNLNDIKSFDEVPTKKKPWYKTKWAILMFILASILYLLLITVGMFVIFADYGQCSRSCRLEFCDQNDSVCLIGGGISGRRIKAHKRSKCKCTAPRLFNGTRIIRRYSPVTDTWELDNKTITACAVPAAGNFSGPAKTYPTKGAAEADGAIFLHMGNCGQCSNFNDKKVYNITAFNLTKTSTKGAFYSIFSRKAAARTMEETGLTESCVECWVENMRHTLIHCFGRCMFGDRSSCTKSGELTDCLLCDEVHSGVFFRRCAGMTRRRAGIVTDICRKPGEIK